MSINTTLKGGQGVSRALAELRRRLGDKEVLVGLPADSGQAGDGSMTIVRLGSIHEFGAEINHPGGTKYVIGEDGKARFVSSDYSGDVAGVTGPHKITIPERSFLRVPLRASKDDIATIFKNQLPKVLAGELTLEQVYDQVGLKAASISQEAISNGIAPANKPSTVKRKKSSKPLIDSGQLRQSITHVVRERE